MPRPSADPSPPVSPVAAGLVWARPARAAARGQRPALSRDQIVQAAIALADAEGAHALTIRRLATRLGSGAMSLYWHVASKNDLLDLLIDAVYGEDPVPPRSPDGWRADLRQIAQQTRRLMHRHPWLAALAGNRALLGPNVLARMDALLGILDRPGLDATSAMGLLGTLNAYVTGFVLSELGEADAIRRTGQTEQEFRLAAAPYVQEQVISSGRYPHLARYVLDGQDRDAEAEFDFGLSCLLDGIAARFDMLDGTAARREPRPPSVR